MCYDSFTLSLYFYVWLFTIVTRIVDCWRIKLGQCVVLLYIPGQPRDHAGRRARVMQCHHIKRWGPDMGNSSFLGL